MASGRRGRVPWTGFLGSVARQDTTAQEGPEPEISSLGVEPEGLTVVPSSEQAPAPPGSAGRHMEVPRLWPDAWGGGFGRAEHQQSVN